MKRTGDEELRDMVDGVRGMPFLWGRTDCVMLALRSVELTNSGGHTPYTHHLEKYCSAAEALRYYREVGSLDKVLQDLGATRVERNFQQVGDVLIADAAHAIVCAQVYLGSGVVLSCTQGAGVQVFKGSVVMHEESLRILRVA